MQSLLLFQASAFIARLRTQVTYIIEIQMLLVKLSVVVSTSAASCSLFWTNPTCAISCRGVDQCDVIRDKQARLGLWLVSELGHCAPTDLFDSGWILSSQLVYRSMELEQQWCEYSWAETDGVSSPCMHATTLICQFSFSRKCSVHLQRLSFRLSAQAVRIGPLISYLLDP